jgi:hypothetical protein
MSFELQQSMACAMGNEKLSNNESQILKKGGEPAGQAVWSAWRYWNDGREVAGVCL